MPAPSKKEVVASVISKLNLDEAAKSAILNSEEAINALGDEILRKQDYSRLTQQLQAKEQELQQQYQARFSQVEGYYNQVRQSEAAYKAEIDRLNRSYAGEREKAIKLAQIASDYNLDVSDVVKDAQDRGQGRPMGFEQERQGSQGGQGGQGFQQPFQPSQPSQPQNLDKLIEETVTKRITEASQSFMQLQDVVDRINHEHFQLYGTLPPKSLAELKQEAISAQVPLYDYAARTFDFEGKRKAVEEAKQREYEERIRKETREQVLSEIAAGSLNPASPTPGGFDILSAKFHDKAGEVRKNPEVARMERAREYADLERTGKWKELIG